MKLSVALAVFNEEENIGKCLESVRDIADEIVIVDGSSNDKTVEIAKRFGSKIIITDNPPIFHINKQKALEACHGYWILQLDADERVSKALLQEIKSIIEMGNEEIEKYESSLPGKKLFLRHQKIVEKRDGKVGSMAGDYNGFFVPRLNFFWGKYLRYGGVYPDGVIRLVKNNKAYFPAKNVHEQIVIDGKVGWLQNDLLHYADTTFKKYFYRNNNYINLLVAELRDKHVDKNPILIIDYFIIKPVWWFFLTQIRHKGVLDGIQGLIFSFFSALRFPRAYWRYLINK